MAAAEVFKRRYASVRAAPNTNIDRDSKALTITTHGIPPYTYDQLQANTAAVVGPQPAVWQTCSVQPVIGADSGRSCDIGEDDEGDHEH